MTKAQQKRLDEYNRDRKVLGLRPAEHVFAVKLDRAKVVPTNKIPDYRWSPRVDRSRDIPSHTSELPTPDATARRSIMEEALSGRESPEVAAEIIRKSKCMAPAYSKGAYQYVGDAESAMFAGRKVK
jgi:hypothetical protein